MRSLLVTLCFAASTEAFVRIHRRGDLPARRARESATNRVSHSAVSPVLRRRQALAEPENVVVTGKD